MAIRTKPLQIFTTVVSAVIINVVKLYHEWLATPLGTEATTGTNRRSSLLNKDGFKSLHTGIPKYLVNSAIERPLNQPIATTIPLTTLNPLAISRFHADYS